MPELKQRTLNNRITQCSIIIASQSGGAKPVKKLSDNFPGLLRFACNGGKG